MILTTSIKRILPLIIMLLTPHESGLSKVEGCLGVVGCGGGRMR